MFPLSKNVQKPSIVFAAQLVGQVTGCKIDTSALQDSGAEGILVNHRFAKTQGLTLSPLPRPIPVRNVDGSDNGMGPIWFTTTQTLRLPSQNQRSYHEERVELLVADIGDYNIILGMDWLDAHNPEVDWSQDRVDMMRCPTECILINPPVTNLRPTASLEVHGVRLEEVVDEGEVALRSWQQQRTLPADHPLILDTGDDAPSLLFVPPQRQHGVSMVEVDNEEDLRLRQELWQRLIDTALPMMHIEPDFPTPAPHLLATVQLDNNYVNKDEPVVEHAILISVDWVLRGLELAHVVLDIEHCTFEPGDVLMYTTEYTEDTEEEEDHAVNVRAAFTHSQEGAPMRSCQTPSSSVGIVPGQVLQ